MHVACTSTLTHYAVHSKWGREAMDTIGIGLLFAGVSVHDGWASYQRYLCQHALCNVHHLRELTMSLPDIDRRLVRTFVEGTVAIIRFRHAKQGLVASELGAYIANGEPAALQEMGKRLIERCLLAQAEIAMETMKAAGEVILCLWDESAVEKPESEKTEGLSVVRSSKAKWLRKRRAGVYNQPGGMPVQVLAVEWASY